MLHRISFAASRIPATRARRVAVGLAVFAIATLLRVALAPLLDDQAPFLLHVAAVAFATWAGGLEAGLTAALCSSVAVDYLFVEPRYVWKRDELAHIAASVLFAIVSFAAVWQVSRWRRAEQAVRAREERLRRLIEVSAQIVWVAEADGRVVEDSPSWRAFTGRSYEELAGWNWLEAIHPDDRAGIAETWRAAVRDKSPYAFEFRARHHSGEYRYMACSAAPLLDALGAVAQWVGMDVDITERKLAEQALRERQEDLDHAQEVARTGSWRLDLQRNELRWSDETCRMFGVPPGTPVTYRRFLEIVHADDRAAVEAAWAAALQGQQYRIDHRIVVGGAVKWVHERAVLEFGPDGTLSAGFGTVQDITERKQMEAELREQHAELQRASRTKDEFLATLSHELRTPLNAILGWSQLLVAGHLNENAVRQAAEVIARNAQAQSRLVDDVLDVSRIVGGSLRLNLEAVDLRVIVEKAVDALKPALGAKGIALVTEISPVRLVADPDRLQQVVWNLLWNAVKFTDTGGHITVAARVSGPLAEIEVTDSGIGIDPDFLPYVFDRFTQADSSTTRQHGGLGLGLAIVKHLTELHGGSVEAASPGSGRGAVFTVRLPVREVVARGSSAAPDSSTVTRRRPALHALAGVHVVAVDDEPDSREVLEMILSGAGAQVVTVASAAEGLAALARHRADVLISDIGMPGEDGYAFIRRVRQGGGPRASIPAVALTAYGRPADRGLALAAGYDDHVAKPVSPDELVNAISALLRRAAT